MTTGKSPIKNYVNSFSLRVRYSDIDRMGFAYYAHYLRWFEIGRTEYLRELGMTYKKVEETGVVYPVTEAYVKYATPAIYDEMIEIKTNIDFVKKASLKFCYEISNAGDTDLHASGYTVHAALGKDGRPMRISDELRKILGY